MNKGRIHSIDTGGMVDGPGVRYVIFFSGCAMRCKYCHNPDTWNAKKGMEKTIEELISDINKYRSYLVFTKGGVTATGGEPLLQSDFIAELFCELKKANIHTTIDTSGYAPKQDIKAVFKYTDLILLDIKSINQDLHKDLTAAPLEDVLETLNLANELQKDVWIRHVLIPNLTDNKQHLQELADYLKQYNNIKKIDILPFHKHGEYKWNDLGLEYELFDTNPPTQAQVQEAVSILNGNN